MSGPQAYALKCPGCGADLKVGQTLEVFACMYCGATVKVQKSGGTVNLSIAEELAGVRKGTDKTAAELAIPRLKQEIAELKREADALSHQRQSLTFKYTSLIGKLQDPRPPIVFAVVVGVASVVACLVVFGATKVGAIIAALISGVASVYTYSSTKSKANARISVLEARLSAAVAEISPGEERLLARIGTKQAKLDNARQVADS